MMGLWQDFVRNYKRQHLVLDIVLVVAAIWLIILMAHYGQLGQATLSALCGSVLVGGVVARVMWSRMDKAKATETTSTALPMTMMGPETTPPKAANNGFDSDFFESLAERMPDPTLVIEQVDTDTERKRMIIYANAEARRLFKLPPGHADLEKTIRQAEVLETINEVFLGGRTRVLSYQATGAVDRFWRATMSPLNRDRSQPVKRVIAVLHDETAAKRNERMRADFLANASHELRTPLASLAGFIETIKGPAREDPDAQMRFLNIMTVQADRMMRLINDLLSLSRVELNEHIPPSNEVDLSTVLQDVLDGLDPIAEERGITIVKPDALPTAPVMGDKNELTQVLQNLVHNAVKYSDDNCTVRVVMEGDVDAEDALTPADAGAPRVSVLTPDVHPGDRYVVFRVFDEGRGVDRQYLPRLCERFYRVEGQKSGDREGTGLGLAIVKHIVNRHRGGFIIESRLDKGSVFSVYFPRHNEEHD